MQYNAFFMETKDKKEKVTYFYTQPQMSLYLIYIPRLIIIEPGLIIDRFM